MIMFHCIHVCMFEILKKKKALKDNKLVMLTYKESQQMDVVKITVRMDAQCHS